jgi:hypothetical protein
MAIALLAEEVIRNIHYKIEQLFSKHNYDKPTAKYIRKVKPME